VRRRQLSLVPKRIQLEWWTDPHGTVLYALFRIDDDGLFVLVAEFEQGPFDTATEVAQWVVKTISREIPPSSC
jgi:hypothetical protein